MPGSHEPLRVALVNDYEIVVLGVRRALERHSDQVKVVEMAANADRTEPVDITLFDNFAEPSGLPGDLEDVVADPQSGRVAVYSWNLAPDRVRTALDCGAVAYLSKTLPASDLVDALLRIHQGETVVPTSLEDSGALPDVPDDTAEQLPDELDWPGRAQGLSAREAEVISLITRGFSNKEVAERAYLSLNTIKAYVRSAYRKMGVTSRSQAVLWGINHGFSPDHSRLVPGGDERADVD